MDLTSAQALSFQKLSQALTKTFRLQLQLVDQLPNRDVVIVAVHRQGNQKLIYYIDAEGGVRHVN